MKKFYFALIFTLIASYILVGCNSPDYRDLIEAKDVEGLMDLLRDPENEFHDKAIASALLEIQDRRSEELLIDYYSEQVGRFGDANSVNAVEALIELNEFGEISTSDILREIFKNGKSQQVRSSAAFGLAKIRDEESVDLFIDEILQRRDSWSVSMESLERMPDLAVNHLIPLIEKESSSREEIIYMLGELGDDQVVNKIVPFLDDDSREVEKAAAEALLKLKWDPSKDTVGAKYLILTSYLDDSQNLYDCIEIGEPAIEPLIEELETGPEKLQENIAEVLYRIDGPKTKDILIELLEEDDKDKQNRAAYALMEFGEIPVVINQIYKVNHIGELFNTSKNLGDDEYIKSFASTVVSQNPGIRISVYEMLGDIGHSITAEMLFHTFLYEKENAEIDEEIESVIFESMEEINDLDKLVPFLFNENTASDAYKFLLSREHNNAYEEQLIFALETFGTKNMAEDFLNCGNPQLEEVARVWAKENNYVIQPKF